MITKITNNVVSSISKWFNVNESTGQMKSRVLDTNVILPMFACRCFVNFNGVPISGTYSRDANGLVTVSMTAHDMTTGMRANLDFTSGTANDGTYVVTVTGVNSFTIQDTVNDVTSGNVTANIRIRASGNISKVDKISGTGKYEIFFLIPMPDINYVVNANCSSDFGTTQEGSCNIHSIAASENAPTVNRFVIGTEKFAGTGSFDTKYLSVTVFR